MLKLVFLFAVTSWATPPDPNLVPIITRIVESNDLDELCELKDQLLKLADFVDSNHQLDETLKYVQLQLSHLGECLSTTTAVAEDITEPPDGPIFDDPDLNAAVMDSSALSSMCSDCMMDYSDAETVEFNENFKSGEEAGKIVKQKITAFFVFTGLGVVAVVLALVLASVFGARACWKRWRRTCPEEEITTTTDGADTFELKL